MKSVKILVFLLGLMFLIGSCNQEFDKSYSSQDLEVVKLNGLINISFDALSSTDYEGDFSNLDNLDFSYLNPKEEKQRINFVLHESGEADLVVEHIDFSEGLKIPHEDLPDDRPSIKKTVISGGFISFYDLNETLLGKERIDRLDFSTYVSEILELKKNNSRDDINLAIRKFQSAFFKNRLLDFIIEVRQNSPILKSSNAFQIIEENENTVTFNIDLGQIEQGQQGRSLAVVDKTKNRLIADRTFDEFGQIIQTTYYGYSSDDIEFLDAIRTEVPIITDSDNELLLVTCVKISNFSFDLN